MSPRIRERRSGRHRRLLGDGLLLLPQAAQPRAPARRLTPAANLFFGKRFGARGFGIDCAYPASLGAQIWSFRVSGLRSSATATSGTVVILRSGWLVSLAGTMLRTGFTRYALTSFAIRQSQRDLSRMGGVSCACGKQIFLGTLPQRSLLLRQYSDAQLASDDACPAGCQRRYWHGGFFGQRRLTNR